MQLLQHLSVTFNLLQERIVHYGNRTFKRCERRMNVSLQEPQLVKVDPRAIVFNKENTNVHEGSEFDKLVESIREHGIFNPPTVRRLPGGIYETIAGEGRVRAAIIAGKDEIDVLSRGLVDDKTARLFLHIDNAVRNFDLISECVGLAQL